MPAKIDVHEVLPNYAINVLDASGMMYRKLRCSLFIVEAQYSEVDVLAAIGSEKYYAEEEKHGAKTGMPTYEQLLQLQDLEDETKDTRNEGISDSDTVVFDTIIFLYNKTTPCYRCVSMYTDCTKTNKLATWLSAEIIS